MELKSYETKQELEFKDFLYFFVIFYILPIITSAILG